jgi:hypothetical protein
MSVRAVSVHDPDLEVAATHIASERDLGSVRRPAQLSIPPQAWVDDLPKSGVEAVEQVLYVLACALNIYRNVEGAGHGRPSPVRSSAEDALLAVRATGVVGELLLTSLAGESR